MQLAAGACRGARFEGATARQHDGDDRAGEVLADDERADERENRERVDAEATVPRRVDHPPRGGHDADERVGGPQAPRGRVEPGEEEHATDREERDGDDQQDGLDVGADAGEGVHSDRSRTMLATLIRRSPRQVLHCATTDAAKTAAQTSTTVEVCMRSSQR